MKTLANETVPKQLPSIRKILVAVDLSGPVLIYRNESTPTEIQEIQTAEVNEAH